MDRMEFSHTGYYSTAKIEKLSTIAINSRDGINATDTASDFTVRLSQPILPKIIQLLEAAVTINNYNLTESIFLQETGFPITPVTLPPGIYNDSNIAAALGAALTAASPAGNVYTVTVDSTNFNITITAVGVTWRFTAVDSRNITYYALGVATSRLPPLAAPALSFTFGAYDFRPYSTLFLVFEDFQTSGNIVTENFRPIFVLTCSSVNSGGVATYSSMTQDHQYWVNSTRSTFNVLHVKITDSRGNVIPLRAGSSNILLSFDRITG